MMVGGNLPDVHGATALPALARPRKKPRRRIVPEGLQAALAAASGPQPKKRPAGSRKKRYDGMNDA